MFELQQERFYHGVKILPETRGLERLRSMKDRLRSEVSTYEQNAKPCPTCDTPGACCLDEHFVNVRVSRLEAVAIASVLAGLPAIRRAAVDERIRHAAEKMAGKERVASFACPLYDRGVGCLVHADAKPVPCIIHACYERREDLPPDDVQNGAELAIDRLNERVYGSVAAPEPLPIAVYAATLRTRRKNAITNPARNQAAT